MRARGFTAVLLLSLPSCTAFVPLPESPAPTGGTEIRARLTTPGAVRVTDLFGRPTTDLEGRVVRFGPDSLYLALTSAEEFGRPWSSADTISLARSELAGLDEKRLDRTRTALFIGGVSVAAGAAIVSLFRAATRSKDEGRGEPPDVTIIPLFRLVR